MSKTSGSVKRTASEHQNGAMRLFSVEWLEDNRFSVERDDGIVFQGTADAILSMLNSSSLKAVRWFLRRLSVLNCKPPHP